MFRGEICLEEYEGYVTRIRGEEEVGCRSCTHLKLGKRESTTGSDTTVVLDRWATDDGTELVYWTRGNGCCFGDTGIATT